MQGGATLTLVLVLILAPGFGNARLIHRRGLHPKVRDGGHEH